eukprot:399901_1
MNGLEVVICFATYLALVESHLFKCPDKYQSACTASKCSSKDADKRALYKCDEWPYWSGGWGSWTEEDETYSCINTTDKYCAVWTVQETKFGKNSTGTCFCIDNNINSTVLTIIPSPNYCSNWICTEFQIFTNCKEDPYTETDICEDLLDTEYNECHCIEASLNNQYCSQWQCLQLKNEKIEEVAIYSCYKHANNFCQNWSGDIEQEWEFELLDCHCSNPHNSSHFCMKWECDEREMTKHYSTGDKYGYFHAIFWPLLVACVLGGSCASGTKNAAITVITVGIVLCSVGVLSGGVGFLMIWLMVLSIPILVVSFGVLCNIITTMQYKRQQKSEKEAWVCYHCGVEYTADDSKCGNEMCSKGKSLNTA